MFPRASRPKRNPQVSPNNFLPGVLQMQDSNRRCREVAEFRWPQPDWVLGGRNTRFHATAKIPISMPLTNNYVHTKISGNHWHSATDLPVIVPTQTTRTDHHTPVRAGKGSLPTLALAPNARGVHRPDMKTGRYYSGGNVPFTAHRMGGWPCRIPPPDRASLPSMAACWQKNGASVARLPGVSGYGCLEPGYLAAFAYSRWPKTPVMLPKTYSSTSSGLMTSVDLMLTMGMER